MATEFISKTVTPTGRYDESGDEILEVVDCYKTDIRCSGEWTVKSYEVEQSNKLDPH